MTDKKPRPAAKAARPKAAPAGRFAVPARATKQIRDPKPADAATVAEIFRRLREANPEPRAELDYINPFTLLVAVVLSAQATDKGVNRATRELFALAETPEMMLALGEDEVREHIRSIGLYRNKAKNVIALSRILVEQHGGAVPTQRNVLETLPGVGRKTASVVVNVAFRQPFIAVDTHIFRVSNRIPLAVGRTPEAVQIGLEAIVPDAFKLDAHHWLILHGRYVCKARKPECWRCPIQDLCRYEPKTPAPPSTAAPSAGSAGWEPRGIS